MLTRIKIPKTSITLWALLVWAYKRQGVQYETDRAFALQPAGEYAGDFLGTSGGQTWEGRGCINGAGTTAHLDAHLLHARVRRLRPKARQLVIATAIAGHPPVWDPIIPALKVVPLWKGPEGRIERRPGQMRVMGKLLKLYPGQGFPGDERRSRHEAVGCWLGYEGCTDAEAAAIRTSARETYGIWWSALSDLHRDAQIETRFERWKISSIGAERVPWKKPLDFWANSEKSWLKF